MDIAEHLSRSQVAHRLGVSPEYVRTLALSGRITYIETPIGRLYDAASVEAFALAREKRQQAAQS